VPGCPAATEVYSVLAVGLGARASVWFEIGGEFPQGGSPQIRAAASFFGRWGFKELCEAAEMIATSTSSIWELQLREDGNERLAAASDMAHVFKCLEWHLDPFPALPDRLRVFREALDHPWERTIAERVLAAVRGIAATHESKTATEADLPAILVASQRILCPFVGPKAAYQQLSGLPDEVLCWPTGGYEDAGQRSFSVGEGPPPAGGAQMSDGSWVDPDD